MRQRQQTTATFVIRLPIPKGSNCGEAQIFIRECIADRVKNTLSADNVFHNLRPEDFTVRLIKKETQYA